MGHHVRDMTQKEMDAEMKKAFVEQPAEWGPRS